ncbi:hypothetical protein BC826DRAFT_1065123 [Russula brevipes]|nr:hypothetical protein BC826DRAFT_1065123 [Russula brevipes]
MSAQPSPYRVQHVEGEPRRHRLEPRRSMVQSAPPPQKLQTPQDREWIKSDSSSLQLQSGGDGWQPKDLQGVPHCSRSETPTPPSSTETILDVAAGVSEGFDIHQNRQQSNYLRIRRDGASVPSHDCYHPDTDDNASMTYDKVNDNYSEQFSDVASETDNGPCSLKTISKRSFSTFSSRSTWSTSSTDSGDTCKVYD